MKKPQCKNYNVVLTESELIRIENALQIALENFEQCVRAFSEPVGLNKRGCYLHAEQAKRSCIECKALLNKIVCSHAPGREVNRSNCENDRDKQIEEIKEVDGSG